jgi:hypothetical protein
MTSGDHQPPDDGFLTVRGGCCNTAVVVSLVASLIPSSPRRRRRLVRIGLVLVALSAAAAAITMLPKGHKPPPEHFSNQPAQLYHPGPKIKLTQADRREIDTTLLRFVDDGMGRKDLAVAYRLSTPALRAGATLADWRHGSVPIYPYQARPGSSRGWSLQFVEGNHAALEVFLQPGKREQTGPITVAVDMRKIHGRWLVDGLAPTAVFSKAGEKAKVFANTDLAPGAGGGGGGSARLGAGWLLVPVVGIAVLMLGLLAVVFLRRDRQA